MAEKKIMRTMDGNEACAHVAYHFTDVAGIFPITPSSPMSEKVDEWASSGRKNMFGQPVTLVEMQSEGGAAGALHGAAEAGAMATTFTSSQGLLLMIPNLYIMAGHRMPAVFHVAARSVAQHANNIFGDHQDVMSCRTTGVTMMSTASVQEVMDLAAVAHLTTVKSRVPFIHFFDGFRTSHEIQKIEVIDLDAAAELLDREALEAYHRIAMNPEHPVQRTTVQGPDVYYQSLEANNGTYDAIPAMVEEYMQGINRITGRDYHIFNYYGAEDAERVVVMMGSACEAAKEVVDYLRARGEKVGLLQIHLFRPFDMKYFLNAMPKTVKKVTAMDRSREAGAIAGAVYLDVCAAYANNKNAPAIYGGRYGLASKDVTPAQLKAVYDNMDAAEPRHLFTIGVVDDVTRLSLDVKEPLITESADTVSCKFWGLGSDGTVGANKNSAKIIGDHAGMYTQAYFEYDSKKSYGITKSHLRFSKDPIRSTYLIKAADFLACHAQSYITRYDMIHEIKDGGTFLLNTSWSEAELDSKLPGDVKKYIADHHVQFYIVDANKLARELGLGNHANMILQAAFFKLSGVMPVEDAVRRMKEAVQKTYAKKGEKVVGMNMAAVDAGVNSPVKVSVPAAWAAVSRLSSNAGGQLGGDVEMMEMLQMGTLDVAVTSTPTIANFTDVLVGCDMPYIWHNDLQAMYSVLTEGDIGRRLLDRMQEEVGIVGLSFLYQPFRHFYTNKPIETLDDMTGLKLRCMQTPVHMAIFEALGCKPVSLTYNDIYSAMQQNTIDGFESDAMGGTASKFYEVADYLTISGHFNNTMVLLMSDTSYSAMSAEDQAVCMAAAAEAAAASLKTSIEANDFHIQNMQDNGMTLCTPDMEPFYAAVQPLIDQYCQEIPEAKLLVDAAQEAVG
ncbi:pyruvate:ferredoxin (flavodoxin) oxidoreductase [Oscillospiraceae bacterium 50-60]